METFLLTYENILNLKTRADFVIQQHQSLWFTPQFKAISECRQKKFSQVEIQNKRSRKVALKPVRQTLVWCERREVFLDKVCAYNERRRVNLKFCLADFVYLIQTPSRGHYNFCIFIAQMYAVTPQLLNQINKIRETEL